MASPGNAAFTSLITTTLQNLPGDIFDNVVTNNTLLRLLMKQGNIKVVEGGRQFTEPLLYQQNNTFAARGKYDPIATTVQEGITRSVWDIKIIDGSVVLSDLELAMNYGSREKLIDYAEEKKMEAEVAMSEIMGDQVFSTSVGANDFDSLDRIISETPSTQTDVGGIDSSTAATAATWWRNYSHDTAVTAFGTGQAGLNAMDTSLNASTFGPNAPTAIITTAAIFTLYQLALTANARYSSMDAGDGGFRNLLYATLPVYFDANCPAGNMYGINTKAIKMKVLSQGNMKATKFEHKEDQLVQIMLMYFFGNLTSGDRRSSFVIDSITA